MRVTAPSPSRRGADPSAKTSSLAAWIAVAGVFALCLARLARMIELGAVNVLFGDQWDFLTPLFHDEGPWASFLWQHGPHRQGAGGVLQWLIYRASGWDVRAEAWAGLAILFVAAAAAVALLARLRGRLAWWDAALVLVVLSPLHWETLLLAPNLAHSILPLCLSLLLVHGWLARRFSVRLASTGLLGALCAFTGFGFCAALAALLVAVASLSRANPDRRGSWGGLGLLVTGTALFFVDYHWAPAIPGWHFPVTEWWDYGSFVAYMEATLLGLREKTPFALGVGAVIFLLTAAVFAVSLRGIWARGAARREIAAALLTGTALIYMASTALGRLPAGLEAAFMWRYTTLTMTGLLGVVIFFQTAIETTAAALWRRLALAVICTVAVTIWANVGPDQQAVVIAAAKKKWVRAYLETRDLSQANEVSDFWVYPPRPDAPHIAERLRWLEKRNLSFFEEAGAGQEKSIP